jgi:diguanylate cyclase (GGDEF)-like protein
LESAQNSETTHAVCYLDLDHLHVINDSFGTDIGDQILKEIAAVLKRGRRHGDMVARLSGDEFALLLSDCNLEQARKIVEPLHRKISELNIERDNTVINVSASLGLAPITSQDQTVTTIIRTAEAACDLAKEKGLNLLHVADEHDEELKEKLGEILLVTDINLALEEDRFRLYYQNIVPLQPDNSEGEHYEILLRMLNEEGETYSPNIFLPAAEHYYLTPKIDCWVIRRCADWLSKNPSKLEKLSVCSINLSGLSIGNSEVLDCIISSFVSSPIPPEKICFEVTETAAILRLEAAMEFITSLKTRGFLFSLDDFGSGYSSFAYLRDLPVDFLKIDGMFVKNMDRDQVNRNMVKTINEIGRSMGIKTIAEFVENEAILKCLGEIEVDYAQGYLIGRPHPWEDL